MAGLGKLILPALKGRMGDKDYYATVMRLPDVVERVQHARVMELSGADLSASDLSSISESDLDPSDRLQRKEDDDRLKAIVEYLRREQQRFFNSLVVAMLGEPQWRHFKEISAPSRFGKYGKFLGFLEFSGNEKMYALDGQHRLSGIKRFLGEGNMFDQEESVGVIFRGHHNTLKGKRRSRRLFTVLNKEVVKVAKRDIIYLDETSAMAITTRALIEKDEGVFSLRNKRVHAVPGNTLPRDKGGERCFTTVGALYDCLGTLFAKAFRRDKTKKQLEEAERLPDDELNILLQNTEEFFQMLGESVPQVGSYFSARTDKRIVALVARWRNSKRGGHVLFRPAGLKEFVKVVCDLYCNLYYAGGKTKRKGDAYAPRIMRQAIGKAAQLPLRLDEPPAVGVAWNDAERVIVPKHFLLLGKVYRHMLGLYLDADSSEVEFQYQNALRDTSAKLPPRLKG